MARSSHSPIIGGLLAVFFVVAVAFSLATPIFEASDEVSHYAVIQHIVDTGELPVQQPGVKTPWEQEGSQPPLYYLLMSVVTRAFDTGDAAERMQRNPHAAPGDPSLDANRNLVIHSAAEDFPWHDTTLAVHVLRLMSIGLGAITISCGYWLARRLFPDRPSISIGTAALIAFNPMFLFISASVNNDNLVIALTSLALILSVQCWYENTAQVDRAGWLRRLALGVVLGAATLTKISGLTIVPVIALLLTIRHLRHRDWRGWFASGLVLVMLLVVIAGWWYWRNAQLYGDLLGLNTMVAIAGSRSASLLDLIPEFDGFRYSYWALFGAVNIVTWSVAYAIFDAFTIVAFVGFAIWLFRARRREPSERWWLIGLLAFYGLLVFIGVIRWTMTTPASQGRLMFPAITALSLMMWLGWETVFNAQFSMNNDQWQKLRWAMPGFMLMVASVSPLAYIAPVYARPPLIDVAALPSDLQHLDIDYGGELNLIGYRVEAQSGADGVARFTLYWQCLKQPSADYSVFVIAYGRNLQEIGKRDAYPQRGLFGTRQCKADKVVVDVYRLRLKADAQRPTLIHLQVGLKDWLTQSELRPTSNGQPLSSVMFDGGQLPSPITDRSPEVVAHYRLGEAIELLGYDVPTFDLTKQQVHYRLYWRAINSAGESYTVFAHLLNRNGQSIGQGDSLPFEGDYPTSVWQAGETLIEERSVKSATTNLMDAQLALGLYRLADGVRLPIVEAAGQRLPDDQIVIPVQD